MPNMIPSPTYERDVTKYIKEYKKAMGAVTDRVSSLAIMDEIDQAQARSLTAQIGYILQDLDKTTKTWVDGTVKRTFKEGQAQAIIDLGEAASLSEAASLASYSMLARGTLEALIADTYQDLLFATQNTSRKVKSMVREVVAEQMRINAAQQLGRKTMKRAIINDLTKKGLSRKVKKEGWIGIVDRAGRRWNLNTYAEMVVRTKLQQSYIEGVRLESLERGVDLAIISSHGATDICAAYEGAVISLNGTTSGYPTYSEIRASGEIFHPNCKHSINALRSPDLLPARVRARAGKATRYAAEKTGIKYRGLVAPTIKKPFKAADTKPTIVSNFVPAKNIKEANAWAAQNLNIAHVDYKGYHVNLANSTNETLEKFAVRYPEVNGTKWVTTSQARNAAEYEERLQSSIAMWKRSGLDDEAALARAKRGVKGRRKVNGNVYAESTNHTWDKLEGICFNQKWAKDYDALAESVKRDVASRWHPVGTENPASIMTHEFGHQVDNLFRKNHPELRQEFVNKYWNKYTAEEIGEGLSRYATKSDAEFFAEAFSEYIHNPEPRKMAAEVGAAMEKAFKTIRKEVK